MKKINTGSPAENILWGFEKYGIELSKEQEHLLIYLLESGNYKTVAGLFMALISIEEIIPLGVETEIELELLIEKIVTLLALEE